MAVLTQQDIASTTTTQANACRVAVFPEIVYEDGELVLDFMDSTTIRLIHDLPVLTAIEWRKGLSLPAVSLDFYNTISWAWILLLYNGFTHPSNIPAGATVNLPDVTSLRKRARRDKNGSVVTI